MMRIGNYLVETDTDSFRIFPKSKDGKTMPVWIHRQFINLRHVQTGEIVVFKRYKHQKRWHWSDSRLKGPVDQGHVLNEIARMVGSPVAKAQDIVIAAMTGSQLAA